jgi:hypothetical protein
VDEFDLSAENWRHVRAAYRHFRVGADTPAYLQEFLARRLEAAGREALAARVRSLGDGPLRALWGRLRQGRPGEE